MKHARLAFAASCVALAPVGLAFVDTLPLGDTTVSVAQPGWLLGCLLFPLLLAWLGKAGGLSERAAPTLASALAFALLTLSLAAPFASRPVPGVHVVALLDVSASVPPASRKRAQDHLAALRKTAGPDDGLTVRYFAGSAGAAAALPPDEQHQTDVELALASALAVDTGGRPLRIVLMSDGLRTRGDARRLLSRLHARGVPVHTIQLAASAEPDMGIAAISAPGRVTVGAPFQAQVALNSEVPGRVRLVLEPLDAADGTLHGGVQDVDLQGGEQEVDVPLRVTRPGRATFRARIEPQGPDAIASNDQTLLTVEATPPNKVLLVGRGPSHASLERALHKGGFGAELRIPPALSPRASDLASFAGVFLLDLQPRDLNSTQARALHEYVAQGGVLLSSGGGGLLGEPTASPVGPLLPLETRSRLSRDEARAALALLIDASGSMAGEKLDMAKAAAIAAARLLDGDDLLEVVGFAGSPLRAVPLQRATHADRIAVSIARLLPYGGTALRPALALAREDLSTANAALKHIVLLTDGQTDESGLPTLARALRAEGITLSTVGLGPDVERELLSSLANLGGGQAHFTDDPRAVPRIFMQETSRVRRESGRTGSFRMVPTPLGRAVLGVRLERAGALRGYLPSQARSPRAEVLVKTDDGAPLLARQRQGAGYTLALATELGAQGTGLLRFPELPALLSRLVRAHSERTQVDRLHVDVTMVQGQLTLHVNAEGHSDDGSPTAEVQVEDAEPLPMLPSGPGRLSRTLPAPDHSTYANVLLRSGGTVVASEQLRLPQKDETDRTSQAADAAYLASLRMATGGLDTPPPSKVFSSNTKDLERSSRPRPLHTEILLGAFSAFLLALALRRLFGMRANA